MKFSTTLGAARGPVRCMSGGPGAQRRDHRLVALGLHLVHHVLHVARERPGQDDAERGVGACLARDEVRSEVGGRPPHAQRRRVRPRVLERVAQGGPLLEEDLGRAGHEYDRSSTVLPSGSLTYRLDAYPWAPNNPSARVRVREPRGQRVQIGRLDDQTEVVEVLARRFDAEEVDDRRRRDPNGRERSLTPPPLVDAFRLEARACRGRR